MRNCGPQIQNLGIFVKKIEGKVMVWEKV